MPHLVPMVVAEMVVMLVVMLMVMVEMMVIKLAVVLTILVVMLSADGGTHSPSKKSSTTNEISFPLVKSERHTLDHHV